MDDEGLSVLRRMIGPWFAPDMSFCGLGDGGLGSKGKGTKLEALCLGAKCGLDFCWLALFTI